MEGSEERGMSNEDQEGKGFSLSALFGWVLPGQPGARDED